MHISKRTIAGVGATGVLLLGAAIPAFAQDATEEPTATEEETTTDDRKARFEERRTELAAALAEELGLDTETVAAALETVQAELAEARDAERQAAIEERLAEAVAAGDLTQEQADALLAAQESGAFGDFGGGRGGHGGHGPGGFGFGFGFGGPDADEAPEAEGSSETTTEGASTSA